MKRELCFCAALALAASATSAQQPSTPSTSPQPTSSAGPISLASAQSTALQQVSALQQAQIDEAIAAEDVRQAEASLLPRARSASTIIYNSPARPPVSTSDPSFIASNAIHEYQELLGVTGDLNFGFIAGIRRARALLRAARAGTEIARRAFVRAVNEAYYGAALA